MRFFKEQSNSQLTTMRSVSDPNQAKALEFFVKAGFKPPATWMYIAGAIETFLTIGLFFGIYTPYVAFIAFIHLLVAAAATYRVTECWIWVIGGVEYCIFWAICCLVVAMHAYHTGM